MLTSGELPALETLHTGTRYYGSIGATEVKASIAAFFHSLGHPDAPPRLVALNADFGGIGEEAAFALAGALEARGDRGLPGFVALTTGDWYEYGELINTRILRMCLPPLNTLECSNLWIAGQKCVDAIGKALRSVPAPHLHTLALSAGVACIRGELLAMALHDTPLPQLKSLNLLKDYL